MRLNDVQEEILSKAEGLIAANLQTLVELGFLEQKDAAATLSRILTTSRIEEAGRDADFVIEAITEDQNAKKEIFKTLDRVCPDPAILASNTSRSLGLPPITSRIHEWSVANRWKRRSNGYAFRNRSVFRKPMQWRTRKE